MQLYMSRIVHWDIDPVIFWITNSFPLKYYGLLFMAGIFLAHFIVKKIYIKEAIPLEHLESLLTYSIIGILLGARLGHCLFYQPSYFLAHPLEIFLPITKIDGAYKFIGFQGLASHGGGIGVIIALIVYAKKYKTNLLWLLDRAAIVTPLVGAFIRFGNFMNSEIYGKPTNGNWGVVFERANAIPRHPTQLYEAFAYISIFAILYFLYSKKNITTFKGYLFGVFLILLFLARFVIEFFKENQVAFENNMQLNMGQWLSIPFILIGVFFMLRNFKAINLKNLNQ